MADDTLSFSPQPLSDTHDAPSNPLNSSHRMP